MNSGQKAIIRDLRSQGPCIFRTHCKPCPCNDILVYIYIYKYILNIYIILNQFFQITKRITDQLTFAKKQDETHEPECRHVC